MQNKENLFLDFKFPPLKKSTIKCRTLRHGNDGLLY